ncbi:MAG: OmpA family protein [Flavobacteriaceae bacterium]|nr:OmpA family protein [Flavobacteriaceae bacterium]
MKQLVLIIIMMFSVSLFSQANKKTAELHFKNMEYAKAATELEEVIKKDGENKELLQMLADSYYYNSQMQSAEPWFKKLMDTYESTVESEYYFKYIHVLKAVNKNDEAAIWFQKFKAANPNDQRVVSYQNQSKEIEELLKKPERYKIELTPFNTPYSDFGAAFYKNEIVFTSVKKGTDVELYKRTNQPFLDLYKAEVNADGIVLSEIQQFSENLNTKNHDGPATFSADGLTMYFTRNNSSNDKLLKNKRGISNLKIFKAQLVNGEWSNITSVPFNNDNYSVGHPALSADEKKLYFASDMPGGYGSADLYVVDIQSNGSFGKAVNLGNTINTEGNELFPFVTKDNLYFSSNGHWGLGALDVFKVNLKDQNKPPVNLGTPINSNLDDFAFVMNENKNQAYVSSNRMGGMGDDDIYFVKAIACYQSLAGTVRDLKTNLVLPDSYITVVNRTNSEKLDFKTDAFGVFKMPKIMCDTKFNITAAKESYKTNEKNFSSTNEFALEHQFEIKLIPEEIIVQIDNVYFDFDKSNIRGDAKVVLDNLVDLMNKYPKMVIEVKSYTDSRGSHQYNDKLSQRRAKSTIDYMLKKGISNTRINGLGYGETVLVNNCADQVNCTEAEHQLNRRSEIVVLKME